MTSRRWVPSALVATAILGLGLAEPDPGTKARLIKPTLVDLDFSDQKFSDIVKRIRFRSGLHVEAHGPMTKGEVGAFNLAAFPDLSWLDRKMTLQSPQPIPFWDAIDRLSKASQITYRMATAGDTGAETSAVSFEGKAGIPSPASYVGPFRIGLIDVKASHVELQIVAEPGFVCRRNGPLKEVEILDENGKSLLGPMHEDARQTLQALASIDGGVAPKIQVPLSSPNPGHKSKVIKTLRGKIPLVVGVLKAKPAVTIHVGNTQGKTFKGGGTIFTVKTDTLAPDGRIEFTVLFRLDHDEEVNRRDAILASLRSSQIRMVDSDGNPFRPQSMSSGGETPGTLFFSYQYAPDNQLSKPPADFLYFDLDRTDWDAPFEFHDIALP